MQEVARCTKGRVGDVGAGGVGEFDVFGVGERPGRRGGERRRVDFSEEAFVGEAIGESVGVVGFIRVIFVRTEDRGLERPAARDQRTRVEEAVDEFREAQIRRGGDQLPAEDAGRGWVTLVAFGPRQHLEASLVLLHDGFGQVAHLVIGKAGEAGPVRGVRHRAGGDRRGALGECPGVTGVLGLDRSASGVR